jgi:hypothetical protein
MTRVTLFAIVLQCIFVCVCMCARMCACMYLYSHACMDQLLHRIILLQDAFTLAGAQYGSHQLLGFGRAGRAPVVVVASGGLATVPGYTLIADEEGAADLYVVLINKARWL